MIEIVAAPPDGIFASICNVSPIGVFGRFAGLKTGVLGGNTAGTGKVLTVDDSESGPSPARFVANTRTEYEAPAVSDSKVMEVCVVIVGDSEFGFDISRR